VSYSVENKNIQVEDQLLLPKDCLNMDTNTLNKDEIIKISLSCDKRFLETTDNKFKTIIKHRGSLASNTSLHCSIFNVQDCYNKEDDTYFSEFT
jgi:hypothetical protein